MVSKPGSSRNDRSGERPQDGEVAEGVDHLPFPDSLCHRCAAPPRYVRTERSVFLYCPILKRYPPQPVRACEEFIPKG